MLITPSFSFDKGIDLDVYFTYDMYGVDHPILEYWAAKTCTHPKNRDQSIQCFPKVARVADHFNRVADQLPHFAF